MDWERIREEYETTKITLKALAEKHDIKLGTLKSRKSREGWSRDATKRKKPLKKDATIKEVATAKIDTLPPEDLKEKQMKFCLHYMKTFNATSSAIKAGYAPASAHVEGHKLLKNPKIATYIRQVKAEMAADLYIDARDVLNKWISIAFADITDFLTFGQKDVEYFNEITGEPELKTVNYVDFNDHYRVDGTIITEVKQGKDGVSIKLADKMKALDKLSNYFDLFPDDFKRKVEDEKLKMQREKLDYDINKNDDDDIFEISVKRAGGS